MEELCARYKSEHFAYIINLFNLSNNQSYEAGRVIIPTGKEMEADS